MSVCILARLERTHRDLTLCMGVPNPYNARVTANEQRATRLPPIRDHSAAALDLEHFLGAAERTNHLHGTVAQRRIIIPVQTDDTIGWVI